MGQIPDETLERDGRVWIRDGQSEDVLQRLETFARSATRLRLSGGLADCLRTAGGLRDAIESILPGGHPVRATAFAKTGTANWSVPWHQDRVIAVDARHDVPGFGNWSRKNGSV